MAKITIANGSAGAVIRAALNDMFTELYSKFVAATAEADGYLTKENFAAFLAKQDALVAATASADGYLDKDDFAAFAAKQDALTDPVTLAAGAPATAGAAGVKGQIFVDGTDIYVCTATNTWIKGALTLATWGEE